MGTHVKDFHFAPAFSERFSRIGAAPARQNYTSQCTRPVKPAKNAEYDENAWQEDVEWQEFKWETEEYEASKGKKEKGRSRTRRGSRRARVLRDLSLPDQLQPRLLEAIDLMRGGLLSIAMMSTKSKPTWRHSTWYGADYMICTVVEPSMKNFTLHFDYADQCDSLNRSWFREMWFPVEKGGVPGPNLNFSRSCS